jgi:hypothetical protein
MASVVSVGFWRTAAGQLPDRHGRQALLPVPERMLRVHGPTVRGPKPSRIAPWEEHAYQNPAAAAAAAALAAALARLGLERNLCNCLIRICWAASAGARPQALAPPWIRRRFSFESLFCAALSAGWRGYASNTSARPFDSCCALCARIACRAFCARSAWHASCCASVKRPTHPPASPSEGKTTRDRSVSCSVVKIFICLPVVSSRTRPIRK